MTIEISRIEKHPIPSGALGDITALHARYYATHWGFDIRFEAEVARELGDFALAFDPSRDGFWLATDSSDATGAIAGSLIIDRQEIRDGGGRLRWFIIDPTLQARGLGRRLLEDSLAFCRAKGDRGLYLKTFAGLDAARKLYETVGFELVEEIHDTDWNEGGITHQTFTITF